MKNSHLINKGKIITFQYKNCSLLYYQALTVIGQQIANKGV